MLFRSQRFSRDKILGIFRVPKAIVAQTEGVNLASAQTAQYVFSRHTIKPKMERLIQQLNEFYLPLFPGTENMFLDYVNPVQDDVAAKTAEYTAGLASGWFTINEVREDRSEEHTSELQSHSFISYAVFCLKKKK